MNTMTPNDSFTQRADWHFGTPGKIIFGCKSSRSLARLVQNAGAERPLIVTDEVLIRSGVLKEILSSLDDAGISYQVYDGAQPEPTTQLVRDAWQQTKKSGSTFDAVITIGGGSVCDLGKCLAILLTHGGDIEHYFGDEKVPGAVVPLISVSTTAGTGSEVSGIAVLDFPEEGAKKGISSQWIRPSIAVFDPLLTVSCPPTVTAHAGIDALVHAVEVFTTVRNDALDFRDMPVRPVYQCGTEYTDALALQAIGLLGQHLRTAVHAGDHVFAREKVHLASLLAGLAFSNGGLGAVHALQLPIGSLTKTSHGLGNGILLPYVMEYNLPTNREAFARIATALGRSSAENSADDLPDRAVEAVIQLRADIGIPNTLKEIGVKDDHVNSLSKKVIEGQQRLLRTNPRILDERDVSVILNNAIHGLRYDSKTDPSPIRSAAQKHRA